MSDSINFFKGHPTVELLPNRELADAFKKVLVDTDYPDADYENDPNNRHPLQYGSDPGNLTVRQEVINWSSRKYGRIDGIDADTVNLTNGSSFGAFSVLSACTSPAITKHAFLVSPTYFLINYSFADFGLDGHMSAVMETPGAEYEIDLALLESKLHQLNEQYGLEQVSGEEINVVDDPTSRGPRKFYRYVMYLVPTFSNPGGLTYSTKTRMKLLEIARKNDLLIISDDVYDFLGYTDAKPPLKFNHLDADTLPSGWRFGNTVSNASFSKIIAPGLRVGWHESPTKYLAHQLATIGPVKSGGTPSQLNTFVVQELIRSGKLDTIITKLVSVYRARSKVMLDSLRKYLPQKYTEVCGGQGGYFVWVGLRAENINLADTITKLHKDYNVVIADGSNFEVTGDDKGWGRTNARLCVALLSEEQIERGIELWGKTIREMYPHLY